ncbi:sugar kinase [Allosaccharopolyspora coralli]|uniref:2-dehydro-3-deoxygluconokinase n=1 Tax=Allosaccharopolyspora coralli TaxID=2665642 RepID=A0A5Q3Q8H2_9PSEU|nr:sugar kinase [Allosaccharopolyspora coralli]QGK70673.1 sugar kinase [Allosaccharopolyspora coralli]
MTGEGSATPTRLLAIGECMIELTHIDEHVLRLGCAGDTFNTAAYLSRCSSPDRVAVDYMTAVGDDYYSDRVLAAIASEGIGTDGIRRVPGRSPGLYLVRTDAAGERSFTYYRSQAPARELFADAAPDLGGYDVVYISAISLQILDSAARDRLWTALDAFRSNGGAIVFDSNYRSTGWPDVDTARHAVRTSWELATIGLPTFADEQALFGDESPERTVARLAGLGVSEIVVKNGASGCTVAQGAASHTLPAVEVERVVDSTAAGDAFNAGYLAARLAGGDPVESAKQAQGLAATVIQHPGAIVDRSVVPG